MDKTKRSVLLIALVLVSLIAIMLVYTGCDAGNSSGDAYNPTSGSNNTSVSTDVYQSSAISNRKIIYKAYVSVYTDDVQKTITAINSKLQEDEWIDSQSIDKTSGNIVYRVKSSRLQTFLEEIKQQGSVGNIEVTSEDVTLNYHDIQAKLDSLYALRTSYNNMISTATDTEELLSITKALSEVETEIAKYEYRKNNIDQQIEYSTIRVYFNQNYYEEDPTFASEFTGAVSGSWEAFGRFLKGLLFVIIYVFPFALVGGVIAVVIIYFVKKKKGLKFFEKAPKKVDKKQGQAKLLDKDNKTEEEKNKA